MSKKLDIVAILDRSGSMSNMVTELVGGFNRIIEEHKDKDAKVSVAIFDDEWELIYNRKKITKIPELTVSDVSPRGCTALFDAIGKTVNVVDEKIKKSKTSKPDKVIVLIITDGLENASKEFKQDVIKKLVEDKKKEDYEFIFLGANIDSFTEAGGLGIDAKRTSNYDGTHCGMTRALDAASSAVMFCALDKDYNLSDVYNQTGEE